MRPLAGALALYGASLATLIAVGAAVCVIAINVALGCGQGGPCWIIGH